MAEKDVSIAAKGQTFNSFVFGTPMITLYKLTGSENYQSWADSMDLWFIGKGCEDHFTTVDTSILKDKRPQWRKTDALLCNILQQSIDANTLYNIGAYKTCYTLWNQVKKLYTNDIQRLYWVISSIANLKQLGMNISSYGGRMFVLKDELVSILPKPTNIETSLSKMDRVFMSFFCSTSGLILRTSGNRNSLELLFQTLMRLFLGYFAISPLPLCPCDMRLHQTLL